MKQTRCDSCRGSGRVNGPCDACSGVGQTMALDFNKLCHKQSLCAKCYYFFPNDMLYYWSGCNHAFCYDCYHPHVEREIRQRGTVPQCLLAECTQELTQQSL